MKNSRTANVREFREGGQVREILMSLTFSAENYLSNEYKNLKICPSVIEIWPKQKC